MSINNKNGFSKMLSGVSFKNIRIDDDFWSKRLMAHYRNTIKACLEKCEDSGRISNFYKAAGLEKGEFEGILFNDSDIYKVIEGIAYSLINNPDEQLEEYTDKMIDLISAAQENNGYLDTYFTLNHPDKKWTDMLCHEDYCAGHLIEAAIAYKAATGKSKLFDIAVKLADHIYSVFGAGERHWITGHQEIELALIKLYKETDDKKYVDLARWFVEERGHGYEFNESLGVWKRDDMGGPPYNQDDKPVRELADIKGHAVRAMYYFCAVTDLAELTGDESYFDAMRRLWDSTVLRNMYITGGIGSSHTNEGFTGDYDLPNLTAYCETCASIGLVYWNYRMNLMTGEAKYADILERAMYNGALAGVSLDGKKFFYENPLESDGTHHRTEWYGCSCCPTQIARFIPSIGDYMYALSEKRIVVNLYINSSMSLDLDGRQIIVKQETAYPWDGKVNLIVEPETTRFFEINLRYPGWCRNFRVTINEEEVLNPTIEKGYIKLCREWSKGDSICLEMEMPVEIVHAHPKVTINAGKAAIQRGPLVYCFEEVDNPDKYNCIAVPENAKFMTVNKSDILDGINIIKVHDEENNCVYTAVPYYAWDNRQPGRMVVWVPENQ